MNFTCAANDPAQSKDCGISLKLLNRPVRYGVCKDCGISLKLLNRPVRYGVW